MEENMDKQDRVIATEGSDIEIDKDGGGGTTLHGVVEEREEEENASEKEDEVDEEEEGEEKEDGGYTFRFENGMNPLDFFDSGVQCYQQLQQHEEEALANKKQKSPEQCPISECNEGNSFKKAREDDISEEKWAEVMEAMNIGGHRRSRKRKQPKKRGRRKGSKKKLDERLSRMLHDANLHYSNCRYDKAIDVLHEVVRLEPNLPDSYHILGLVHKELGDYKKETDFYMIAAILKPKYSSIGQKVEDLLADPENEKWLSISSEFCGGTHISNTRDAEAFALLAEEGIAKGIRRVTAVTTDRAYDAIKMADEFEQQVDDAFKLKGSLLEEKVSSLKGNVETLSIPAAKKAEIKTKIALLQGTDASHVNEAMDLAANLHPSN